MTSTIVRVNGVSHRYAREWAVQNISFDIDEPGIVGLLGSNGAGKSTIMNIICGALHATKGDVFIHGHSIRDKPLLAKQQLGFLPQQVPLHLDFTVDEYLHFCAGLRRIDRADIGKSVERAKEKVGVTHFSKRLVGALSGGYRQRVGIAGAILHKPSIVVFDEPTNGLDPVQILEVRSLIKEIAEERAVLLSTHIMPEVEALCDDIKMIEGGEIVFQGSIGEYMSVVQLKSILTRFENPPSIEVLARQPGVIDIDEVSANTYRLHVAQDVRQVSKALIEASVVNEWGATEISLERATLEQAFSSFIRSI